MGMLHPGSTKIPSSQIRNSVQPAVNTNNPTSSDVAKPKANKQWKKRGSLSFPPRVGRRHSAKINHVRSFRQMRHSIPAITSPSNVKSGDRRRRKVGLDVRDYRGWSRRDGNLRYRSRRMQRLFTPDEMVAIRAKRVELQAAYAPQANNWKFVLPKRPPPLAASFV